MLSLCIHAECGHIIYDSLPTQARSKDRKCQGSHKKKVVYSVLFSNNFFCHGQPVFFNIKGYISLIKPDQAMWYRACKICSKKVTEAVGSGYWCEACQKNDEESSLR